MKTFNTSLLALVPLLGASALARPQVRPNEDTETIPQESRMTAFIMTDKGPQVECWAVGDLLPDEQVVRRDGSSDPARRVQLFDEGEEGGLLAGVDILTWPSYAPLYPPPAGAHSNANFDFTGFSSSFTLLKGLVVIERLSLFSEPGVMQEGQTYYFGPDNGDDWFYFEDSTTSNSHRGAKASSDPSMKVSTVSGGETTMIQFKHRQRPQHRVLHKGACNFAGLVEDQPGKNDRDLAQTGRRQAVLEL